MNIRSTMQLKTDERFLFSWVDLDLCALNNKVE